MFSTPGHLLLIEVYLDLLMSCDIINACVDIFQNRGGICLNVQLGVRGGIGGEQTSCRAASAPPGQIFTVLTVGVTRLMRGVYLSSRERWSD